MKHFLQKTSFFLIFLVLHWAGLECFYRFVPNNYTEKHKNVQKHYENTNILIFGDSHTLYGLNPNYFDQPTFNFANISQSVYFDKLLFDKHFYNFKNLNYVIISVEYMSLSQQDDTSEDVWRKYFYQAYMDLDVSLISFYDPKQYSLALSRPLKKSIDYLKQYFKDRTLVSCDFSGWGTTYNYEKRKKNLSEISPKTIKKHEDNRTDFSINSKRIEAIISECNRKNVRVLLVTMPVNKDYAQGVNPQKLQKIIQTAQNIANNHQNCRYLNLFQHESFSDDDFYDPDHLNHKGAEKCSVLVSRYLEMF